MAFYRSLEVVLLAQFRVDWFELLHQPKSMLLAIFSLQFVQEASLSEGTKLVSRIVLPISLWSPVLVISFLESGSPLIH